MAYRVFSAGCEKACKKKGDDAVKKSLFKHFKLRTVEKEKRKIMFIILPEAASKKGDDSYRGFSSFKCFFNTLSSLGI